MRETDRQDREKERENLGADITILLLNGANDILMQSKYALKLN
jgi:hypothetical protein